MRAITRIFSLFSLSVLSQGALLAQVPADKDSVKIYHVKEVVITTTRGEGEILDVPMAIGVIRQDEFLSTRRLGLNEALWGMPGVLVQSRAGGQDVRLTVRGFGARGNGDRSNAATIRGVKILLDGIPETEPDGRTSLDLLDLSAAGRIEAVRSNSSSLFGSASGGVINVESQTWFAEPYLETSNSFGSYGFRKSNIAVGVLFGSSRLLLSGTNSNFDGWRNHTRSRSTHLNAVLSSSLDASTRLRVMAGAASTRLQIPGALTQAQFETDPTMANPLYELRQERRYNRVGKLGFSLSRSFGEHHSVELLGFVSPKILERSERGTFRDFNRYHIGGGVLYSWNSIREGSGVRVTVGVDEAFQDGTLLFYELVNGERGDSLRTDKEEAAETFGVFAQGEIQLANGISMLLGARLDRQVYRTQSFPSRVHNLNKRDKLTFTRITPKSALLYRISKTHSIYLSVAGGLEAPAFNEVDPPPTLTGVLLNPLLKPMTSRTVEIGAKGVAEFGRHHFIRLLSYDAAAYWISVENEIVPFDGGAWYFSAGKSRRLGFELGGELVTEYGLSLKSAVTYLDAAYVDFRNELGDFAGHKVPGISPTVFHMRLRYVSDFGGRAELGVEHMAGYFADDANSKSIPSYTVLNASLGYAFALGKVRVKTFVGFNNLTDKKYVASAFINPVTRTSTGGWLAPAYLEPGLPRNFFGGFQLQLDV